MDRLQELLPMITLCPPQCMSDVLASYIIIHLHPISNLVLVGSSNEARHGTLDLIDDKLIDVSSSLRDDAVV